ncbi:sulfotransferase [uncultured Croceicoccus sp.]|uniref:sulfotransferase family protein n=1 Tax=uncultured Croceicoccus sp. TaxID=1295329 RepID=UPI00260B41ED|nr:sulfotransferase [uncultured Croceicoccus sp.]
MSDMRDARDPLARGRLADRASDALAAAWRRGWLPYPTLDPDALWAKARRGFPADCENFGRSAADVADFAERVRRLTTALEEEARLNPLGRAMAHGQIVRIMRQHLALGRLWRDRPEMARTPMAPPIIVVGQMRSGTTRLHRLLAADPALSATRFCDSWSPVPQTPDLRPVMGGFMLWVARRLDPWIDSLHPFGAARVDEELGWLTTALLHPALEAQWRIPSFSAWSEARDPAPCYREFARILASDAAHRGNADRPRVLKVPQFSEDLAAVMATFPDARIVTIDRARRDVTASAASLVANQMIVQSDHVDPAWIGAEWTRKVALREARMEAALEHWDGPLVRLSFAEFDADWRAAIGRCYDGLDLPLSAGAEAAMAARMKRARHSPHRRHRYDPADFGLPRAGTAR